MQWSRPLFWALLMGVITRSAFAQGASAQERRTVSVSTLAMRSASQAVGITNASPSLFRGTNGGDNRDTSKDGISDENIQHNLNGLNALRAKAGIAPLKLDARLCKFALAGSLELLKTHTPHGHFKSADVWGSGFENAAAENQGDPHGWPPGPVNGAIDQILQAMMDEGPGGGHHDTILNSKYNRVGIGLVKDKAGRLYFTNDFSG